VYYLGKSLGQGIPGIKKISDFLLPVSGNDVPASGAFSLKTGFYINMVPGAGDENLLAFRT
jgi:hypothetical protein